MLSFIKRPLYALTNKIRRKYPPVELMKEKWVADFSKPERSCFDIKPEISYNAKLEKKSLFLGLKKKNCMAWLETASRVYVDQVIEARFRFDCSGGYCATGIMFRVMENGTYYLALVSSKGYFRLDAVNSNVPQPLVGWTEIPDVNGDGATSGTTTLGIVARGGHLIFTIGGKWIAEVNDTSVPGGHLGFVLVSYDSETAGSDTAGSEVTDGHVCQAWLDHLSVDSRPRAVEDEYRKWSESEEISTESRLCLAETFAALDRFDAAYSQVLKAWKQRENAARSVTATFTDMRTGNELLFAARLASHLGRYETAEGYINTCLSAETKSMADSANEMEVFAEKAKILSALDRFDELVEFLPDYIEELEAEHSATPSIPPLYALLGHAWWNLKNYEAAANAWARAFDLNRSNGLYTQNAAVAYEMLDKKEEALRYFLEGGNCFLRQADFEKLGVLVPKLLAVGQGSREAQEIAERWAESTGASIPDLAPEHTTPVQSEAVVDFAEPVVVEEASPPGKGGAKKPSRAKKAAQSDGDAKPAKEPKAKTEKKPTTATKAGAKAKAAKTAESPKTTTKAKDKPAKERKAPGESAKTRAGKTAQKPAIATKTGAKATKATKSPESTTTKAKAKPAKEKKAPGDPAKTKAGKTAKKPATKG